MADELMVTFVMRWPIALRNAVTQNVVDSARVGSPDFGSEQGFGREQWIRLGHRVTNAELAEHSLSVSARKSL